MSTPTPLDEEWERIDSADIVVSGGTVVRSPIATPAHRPPFLESDLFAEMKHSAETDAIFNELVATPPQQIRTTSVELTTVPHPRTPTPEPEIHVAVIDLAPEVVPGPIAPRAATPRPVTPPPRIDTPRPPTPAAVAAVVPVPIVPVAASIAPSPVPPLILSAPKPIDKKVEEQIFQRNLDATITFGTQFR